MYLGRFSPVAFLLLAALAVVGLASFPCPASLDAAEGAFPRKPIKIIVYTGAGGPIDMTVRQFVDIARSYTDATFVVENKPGSGGITAIEKLLQVRADGYTLFACTKSNIAQVVSVGREGYLEALDWQALLLIDPECVITNRTSRVPDWDALLEDARHNPDGQVWLGPASGGLDHVMAMQIWDRFGIKARWVPCKSGGDALGKLLGKQGVAYVGNPADAVGNPDLQVSIVSSPERLPQLPNTPVFSEYGVNDLNEQFMWRGFALKKGCPPAATRFYAKLFQQITEDRQWRTRWEKEGIEVVYRGPKAFTETVEKDRIEFTTYLKRLGMVPPDANAAPPSWLAWSELRGLVLLISALAIGATFLISRGAWERCGHLWILAGLVAFAGLLFVQTLTFPRPAQGVGAAAVPRLWIIALLIFAPLAALSFRTSVTGPPADAPRRVDLVLTLIGLLALYVALTVFAGYYVSSLVFLLTTMWILGERRPAVLISVSFLWLVFAYVTFARLLFVQLPLGRWFES